jgi:hypothetical protein
MDYYDERKENFIVGIIDKNLNKLASDDIDLFKIREPRAKVIDKKRGTGIPTLKGSVCSSKDKFYLMKVIRMLFYNSKKEIERINSLTRENICKELMNKLLYLEKYSTTKNGNKMTYVIIPANHHKYEFPYNLEDRIKYIQKELNKIAGRSVDMLVKRKMINDLPTFELTVQNEKYLADFSKDLQKMKFKLEGKTWSRIVE